MVKKNKQLGGDGYVINVNEAIGGLPAFTRYSNNYRPIFDGELLQNGGDGYSVNVGLNDVGGQPVISRYNYCDVIQKGAGGCGCNDKSDDPTIFNLIKEQIGGKKKDNDKVTQFHAIEKISYILTPLSLKALIILIIKIFLYLLSKSKSKKAIQFGGYSEHLQSILAPLGKNNLLVLASLLLLHHFAIDNKKTETLSGGANDLFNDSLSEILAPLGVNTLGTSIVLILLQQAFTYKKPVQKGGNPLKNLIAPLGTNAFIATGLLIILEKLFTTKVNEVKLINKNNDDNNKKKDLIGGKLNKKFENLFNVLTPLTFNIFAKESFLKKMVKNKKNNINNKS